MRRKRQYVGKFLFIIGMLVAAVLIFLGNKAVRVTSTDDFCASCHIHPHSTQTWKLSTHYDNSRGIHVHCVDCHLPPHGEGYLAEKTRTGIRDVWGKLFKDPENLNWEAMSQIEYSKGHVFELSCIHCHQNNFPLGLTQEGREAHLYYEQQEGELHCINCHITVGHHDPDRLHAKNSDFGIGEVIETEIYSEPGIIDGLTNFTEYIPGSAVSFEMVAIHGGSYVIGSPEDEPFRRDSEGPLKEVSVSPFFMGKIEVTWNEYLAFFKQTGAQGKTADAYLNSPSGDVDAISGPTPPWGAPDQGWGTNKLPAITMTHHAAVVYCQWLSKVSGKHYRLPTEAEWEYAARGGTSTPYFFEGDPKRYTRQGLRNKVFGTDTSIINSYISYIENSRGKTINPGTKRENPFGLEHMLGNVAEFCADWYVEDVYAQYPNGVVKDPTGPPAGEEHVIRGGSFRDGGDNLRCASRDVTRTTTWLRTDPQIPKSIWWYSDCNYVGFRVVCEYNEPESAE
ncbi:MAG: SUMF1/EgtB/PvdO family nonheme iron enzyme [Bacteroidales bacterium]|nr:SUMF1/EgtB/PvdO family nonheme iron enzyme [Bacteroidales bacterium]